jgi:hypothetical protein
MTLTTTYKEVLYLFNVNPVRDKERKRQLFFIQWADGYCLLIELVPVINEWLRQEGVLLDAGFERAVLAEVSQAIARKVFTETIELADVMKILAERPSFVINFWPESLSETA